MLYVSWLASSSQFVDFLSRNGVEKSDQGSLTRRWSQNRGISVQSKLWDGILVSRNNQRLLILDQLIVSVATQMNRAFLYAGWDYSDDALVARNGKDPRIVLASFNLEKSAEVSEDEPAQMTLHSSHNNSGNGL